jgi:hypothetical protein
MTEEQIKHMVERFLAWRLPEDFNPDAGITFTPNYNVGTAFAMRYKPVGTNLFNYAQAEAMVRHMLGDELTDDAKQEREAGLKPCPCCETDAVVLPHAMRDSIRYNVKCVNDGCGLATNKFGTEAEAITAWSTRSQSTDTPS